MSTCSYKYPTNVESFSQSLSYAIFDLSIHKEYLEPLRSELEGPGYTHFLQTAKGLPLLDSFLKESSRMNPFETGQLRFYRKSLPLLMSSSLTQAQSLERFFPIQWNLHCKRGLESRPSASNGS